MGNTSVETAVMLYNVRSAYNVGSIFRTADAAGVEKIILAGYSPAPLDRFGRKRKDIAKTALGAQNSVKWESAEDASKAISELKRQGYKIMAVEQDERAIYYKDFYIEGKAAFIFGNEVEGLPEEILAGSDEIIEISLKGEKESLNVSVTAGIILFSYLNYCELQNSFAKDL